MDPYKLLGVSRNASDEEIKKAFREQAKRWHPDRNPGDPEAETRFKEIGQAYKVLSDPAERSLIDQGRKGFIPRPDFQVDFEPGDYGFDDLIGDLLRSPASQGFPDLEGNEVRVRVPASVLLSGGVVRVPVGGEKISVRVPAGSRQGSRLRLRDQGPAGGDLILILES